MGLEPFSCTRCGESFIGFLGGKCHECQKTISITPTPTRSVMAKEMPEPITAFELENFKEFVIDEGWSNNPEDRGLLCVVESYKQAVRLLRMFTQQQYDSSVQQRAMDEGREFLSQFDAPAPVTHAKDGAA